MVAELNRGQICLSINGTSAEMVLEVAARHGADADIVEIRLDLLDKPECQPFFKKIDRPLLFTNRPKWEGGGWQGTEDERVALLKDAIRAGAQYVDIELRASETSRQGILAEAASTPCQTIISWHDFSTTPDQAELHDLVVEMAESGADIGKLVTTAKDYTDTLRVMSLQLKARELGFPLACFSMGRAGQISRAATLHLGGVLTYGAADAASCTAPGQLPVASLRAMVEMLS